MGNCVQAESKQNEQVFDQSASLAPTRLAPVAAVKTKKNKKIIAKNYLHLSPGMGSS